MIVTDPLTSKAYADNESQHRKLVCGTLAAHSKKHGHAMTTQQAAESNQLVVLNGHHPRNEPDDPMIAMTLNAKNGKRYDGESETFLVAAPVTASNGHHGHSSPRGDGSDNLLMFTLKSVHRGIENGWQGNFDATQKGVRRLMPIECLRLQGFPDDWLDLDPPLSDSAKYRLIGNAVTVTVATWIGRRIMEASCNTTAP